MRTSFDASIQTTPSGRGIDIHWTVLKSEELKENCLKSVDVYNGNFRIMHQVTPDNPVITMDKCTETVLTLKYNFQQNPRKPEVILSLSPSPDCETYETKSTDKVVETVTSDTADSAEGEEDTTVSLQDATTTGSVNAEAHDDSAHRREENGNSSEDVPAASNTIMIGSVAACAVVIPTLLLVGVLVVKRRAESNQHSSQVQEFHFLSHMIIHSKLTPPSCRFNYEMGRT